MTCTTCTFAHFEAVRRRPVALEGCFVGVRTYPQNVAPSALRPVRYTGVMTERWMIGRVRIIRYPLRRQQMRGWTWVKDDSRTVLEVFNGRSMWVFEVLPK